MTASYDSVKALLARGISRPTLYEVIMPLDGGAAVEQMRFLCSSTAVPAASANTIAVNGHEAMGVVREQPTFVAYDNPFSVTVIADRDYTVYKGMREWFETLGRNVNPFGNRGQNAASQKMSYYDTFKRNITLRKLELEGNSLRRAAHEYKSVFEIEFNNAFPVRMGDISLSSDAFDQKVEFQIDFAYETYTFRDMIGEGNGTMFL